MNIFIGYLIVVYTIMLIAHYTSPHLRHQKMSDDAVVYWLMPILLPLFMVAVILGCLYAILIIFFLTIGYIVRSMHSEEPLHIPPEPL